LFFILKSLLDLVIPTIDFHVYLNLVTALFFALFMTHLLDFVLKKKKKEVEQAIMPRKFIVH
jgi:hypothetical protein